MQEQAAPEQPQGPAAAAAAAVEVADAADVEYIPVPVALGRAPGAE